MQVRSVSSEAAVIHVICGRRNRRMLVEGGLMGSLCQRPAALVALGGAFVGASIAHGQAPVLRRQDARNR
jgi:hypothetical protein